MPSFTASIKIRVKIILKNDLSWTINGCLDFENWQMLAEHTLFPLSITDLIDLPVLELYGE